MKLLREDLYELADLFGDENLRTIASKYVFGINHPDFESLLDKNDNCNLNQYLKNKKDSSDKTNGTKDQKINKQIKQLRKQISKRKTDKIF